MLSLTGESYRFRDAKARHPAGPPAIPGGGDFMAFVRWRGNCAQLLATFYENGRSRQCCLANLPGRYAVPGWLRTRVDTEYPDLVVDWERIDRALAAGPPGTPTLTTSQQSYLEIELPLRTWAQEPDLPIGERRTLESAANVLTHWRAISSPNDI